MIHILTEAMGTGNITPASWYPEAEAGDTIIISADRVSVINLRNFNGTPTNKYTFTNPTDAKVEITDSTPTGIQIFDSDNFIIRGDNCASETYGFEISTLTNGIRLWRCADWDISYIHIHDVTIGISQNNNDPWTESNNLGDCRAHHNLITDTSGTFAEGIYLGKSTVGNYPKWNLLEIDNNHIENTSSDGIQAGQISGNLKIHDNYLKNVGTDNSAVQNYGIIINVEANESEIYRNNIIRARGHGITVHYDVDGATHIHDNVIWEAGCGGLGNGIHIFSPSGTSKVINNTIVEAFGYGIRTLADETGEIRYNLLINNGFGGISSNYSVQNDNRIQAYISNENFVDATNGDFHLTNDSPAVDAGVGTGYSTTDFDGVTRPQGSAPDIGAYEYIGDTDLCEDVVCNNICFGRDLWSQKCNPETGLCAPDQLIESNSAVCDYDPCEDVVCDDFCDGTTRYYNGACDPVTGECLYDIEANSEICGYVSPEEPPETSIITYVIIGGVSLAILALSARN